MQPNHDLVGPLSERGYVSFARLRPRAAREIAASPWSIGLETIDRRYVEFAPLARHIGELGVKHARVQAGWARCEPVPGAPYDWGWLDEIVERCVEVGVTPWLQTSYGNPAYPGGGGIGLAQGLPTSPEALAAWDRWVTALAARYGGRVGAWEIWNEPDNHDVIAPEAYAAFFIRTAANLRGALPRARILGLGLAWHDEKNYAGRFLAALAAAGRTELLDELSFHFYPHNPDDQFEVAADLARLLRRYAPHVTLRQGETGAPSECTRFMALGEHLWNERKQAVWNLRRMLAHHAAGIPMNLFQLADMFYEGRDGALFTGVNPKGQLRILPDKSVAYRKPSWFAVGHVCSLLDDRFELAPRAALPARAPARAAAHAWTLRDAKEPALIAWWQSANPPDLVFCEPPSTVATLGLAPVVFREPVLLDWLSGVVFKPPAALVKGDEAAWAALPFFDAPLALVERGLLALDPL
jgi:hypothetical protein